MQEENKTEVEDTQDKDAQKIIDKITGEASDEEEVDLPSNDNKLFAEKYETVEDLKNGIAGLKSSLPQYVIDGMSEAALEQHYVELRKEFSGKKEDTRGRKFQEEEAVEKKEEEKTDSIKETDPALWKTLETQFNTNGKISSEQYDKLEKMGIPSEIVDNYLDGLQGKRVSFTNSVYEIAGGQDGYAKIKEWAEDGNISQAEIDVMQKMPYDTILSMYKGVKARYDLANKQDSGRRIAGNTTTSSGSGYKSQSEYMSDVADKRYGQNRAYSEAVDKKFANSKFN